MAFIIIITLELEIRNGYKISIKLLARTKGKWDNIKIQTSKLVVRIDMDSMSIACAKCGLGKMVVVYIF
jgi:hypothetical protein